MVKHTEEEERPPCLPLCFCPTVASTGIAGSSGSEHHPNLYMLFCLDQNQVEKAQRNVLIKCDLIQKRLKPQLIFPYEHSYLVE